MPWNGADNESNRNAWDTAAVPVTRCSGPDGPCTPATTCTDRQREHLMVLFTADEHVDVEATWGIYQRIIAAYRHPDRTQARERMQAAIDTLREGVPTALTELRTFGRTLARRAEDVLAYFDRPGTSNGPTEAINGRLEHLRGSV